jgi:hypothetical protein
MGKDFYKEAVVVNSRYYSGICLGELRKTTKTLRIVGVRAEIRNKSYFSNMNLESYCCEDRY